MKSTVASNRKRLIRQSPQRVGHIPTHASEHDFQRVMQPLQDLVQGAVDQTVAEIKHGLDCRLCLLRQDLKADACVDILMRQNKYLNNLVEQDHRAVKKVTGPMLGSVALVGSGRKELPDWAGDQTARL